MSFVVLFLLILVFFMAMVIILLLTTSSPPVNHGITETGEKLIEWEGYRLEIDHWDRYRLYRKVGGELHLLHEDPRYALRKKR